jgi:hypothetical protein
MRSCDIFAKSWHRISDIRRTMPNFTPASILPWPLSMSL